MVGKAGGRQPKAPIHWLSSQRSPEMKGCARQLETQATFVRIWNMRPRHRGFTHRRMAPDGGAGFVWLSSSWVTCTVGWQVCIGFLVCPSKPGVYHAQFLCGTGRGVCDSVVGSEVCDRSAGLGGLKVMPSRIGDQNVSLSS